MAGAMAMVFWAEPIPTYDLDVLVLLPGAETTIVSLAPLYDWARGRGYPAQAEHVIIAGVPVQFLPAHNSLAEEAIDRAVTPEYEGVPVRVVRPEYQVALYLEPGARTPKRRERAAALMESGALDRTALQSSDVAQLPRKRPRPSPELLDTLRAGKAALRRQLENLPLREKVRMVLELQRLRIPLIEHRHRLEEWERPWAITP